ncbi:MAG: HAD-IIB family hydrolase [Rhodospirillales bacterium]|nr:HAD-IIB family hydrolase [Rhodospirillales bacterium]
MKPLECFPHKARRAVRWVLTDIDDTLTTDGRMTAEAYGAMEQLRSAGLLVIPVTGRPAGWCDHIARMWPIDAVVGENGAFYFRYDHQARRMTRRFGLDADERAANRRRLDGLRDAILREVPGAAVASDQPYREADLAIDYCEDVPPLPPTEVERVVAMMTAAGATAKVSSIHVNGWFGTYDKLTMTRILLEESFAVDLDAERDSFVFVGDSPNDAPLFAFFPNAVGVANIRAFDGRLATEPAYVTRQPAGAGFAELAETLLEARL